MCSGHVGDLFSKLGKSMNWRFHRQCSSILTSSVPGFAAPCPSSYVLGWQGTRNSQNLYRILEWNFLKIMLFHKFVHTFYHNTVYSINDMPCEGTNLQSSNQWNTNMIWFDLIWYYLEALQWVEVWTVEDFLWPRVHVHPSLRFAVCRFHRLDIHMERTGIDRIRQQKLSPVYRTQPLFVFSSSMSHTKAVDVQPERRCPPSFVPTADLLAAHMCNWTSCCWQYNVTLLCLLVHCNRSCSMYHHVSRDAPKTNGSCAWLITILSVTIWPLQIYIYL